MNKGRPPGATNRIITHHVGNWSWDTNKLHAKIKKSDDTTCWEWTGSKGPQGNLFGAYKNGHTQMTQTNRILLMEKTGEPCEHLAIKMRCQNRYCCNPQHFSTITPNHRTKNRPGPTDMYRLTISEHRLQDQTKEMQDKIKDMAREFGHLSGIDWEWENRWMVMPASDLLIAQIKYADVLKLFTSQQIK